MKNQIERLFAREILDSRGNPTIEVKIFAGDMSAVASVPSGASTGVHEALELRDDDEKRYGGLGVLKACKNINGKIAKAIIGMDPIDQVAVDECLLALDKTPNKAKLGANSILGVSLAVARLGAVISGKPLYKHLADCYGFGSFKLPTPLFNVINGGRHADNGLDVQEFFIIPNKAKFSDNLRMGSEVYHVLKKNLKSSGLATGVGDEGGFAPVMPKNEIGFKMLVEAITRAGYKMEKDFWLGADVAASEFYDKSKHEYKLKADKAVFKPVNMYKLYQSWRKKYPIAIIEDGCSEDDVIGWKLLTQHLKKDLLLVGDDLFVTNTKRIQMGVNQHLANAVLIKPNQIGSVTETMAAVKLAYENDYKVVVQP
jgi:enolase